MNTNYFPTAKAEDASYHLAMGSRRVPDNGVRGTSESWWRLQGSLGLADSLAHSTSVDEDSYKSDCYEFGIDVEKLPVVSSSGEDLSAGSTVFLKVKGMGSSSSDVPRQCRVCAHSEKVISIQDTVVEVFE